MRTISENRCFGGVQGVYAHESAACGCEMTFGLFLPPQAEAGPVPGGRYILVDWGAAFAEQHAQRFPQMGAPLARVATARLALALLEENHGSAYLTEAIAAPALVSGRLQRVADAQDFRLGVIAAWRQHGEAAADIRLALELLRPPPG